MKLKRKPRWNARDMSKQYAVRRGPKGTQYSTDMNTWMTERRRLREKVGRELAKRGIITGSAEELYLGNLGEREKKSRK